MAMTEAILGILYGDGVVAKRGVGRGSIGIGVALACILSERELIVGEGWVVYRMHKIIILEGG